MPNQSIFTTANQTLRQQLRRDMRRQRQALSQAEQQQAAVDLVSVFAAQPTLLQAEHIALYLSNDAELDTSLLIDWLWQQGKQLYLPILHPVCPGHLLFQRYSSSTPMQRNRFGIPEPVLNCSQICPLSQLSLICLPLVAFDAAGNRMGMGGGFYDRTLAQLPALSETLPLQASDQRAQRPMLLGLAHQCQQLEALPQQAWDIPLHAVLTPTKLFVAGERNGGFSANSA
jgi:5-formyltetrahydrofolate cyclo-ligase